MTTKVTDASPASANAEDPNAQATAQPDSAAAEDANPAQSSGADATDAKSEPQTLRDVVVNVVKQPEAPAESSTVEAEAGDQPADPEAKAEGDAEDPDANVPFHNHPRWKELVEERNALKPEAENYRKITQFMDANRLSGEEVAEGFEIMALLKAGDPGSLGKARQWMAERLELLDRHLGTGGDLPEDLQRRVEDGLIDEASAREIVQARAKATLLEQNQQQANEQAQQTAQAAAARAQAQEMAQTAADWETRIKGTDPDYAKKAGLVEAQVRAELQARGKPPTTKAETLELIEAAYRKVNDSLKAIVPAPKAVSPNPTGVSAAARPEPKSLREAAEAALRQSR